MDTSLYIDIPATHYLPGSKIEGKVMWVLDRSPREVRLSLGWWTEGRGSKDAKIESEEIWETSEEAGERAFSFPVPASPYSLEGSLISLKWGLELSARETDRKELLDVVISPMENPVKLDKIEIEGLRKSFSIVQN